MQPPLPPPPGTPGPVSSGFLPRRGRRFAIDDSGTSWVVWEITSGFGSPVSIHPRSPEGYAAALRRFHELETTAHRPFFRRAGVGWVLLNVLIGFVLSIGLLILETIGAISVHGELLEGRNEPSNSAVLWPSLISIVAGILGWLLFCYLPSPRSRGLGLAVTYVGAIAVGGAMLASSIGPA